MKEREVAREMERMETILDRAQTRFSKHSQLSRGGEAVDWADPAAEMMAREEQALRDAEDESLSLLYARSEGITPAMRELIRRAVWEEFRQYEDGLMEWLFAAGPRPLEVVRRLFAYVKMKRASLLWNMGFRDVGPLLRETHAAAQLRCRALFGTLAVGWSKPASAVAKFREAQKGNCNRLGGKKRGSADFAD